VTDPLDPDTNAGGGSG